MSVLDEWRRIALATTSLSDEKLLAVLKLVEDAPDRTVANEVLTVIRPRLTELKPPRPVTPQRLLFMPVEDLFDRGEASDARIGRIPRQIIGPCWRIIESATPALPLAGLKEALRTIDPQDRTRLGEVGARLWPAAATAIRRHVVEGHAFVRDESDLTQGDDQPSILWYLADLLAVAERIQEAKDFLPPAPITTLAQADLDWLLIAVSGVAEQSPRRARAYLWAIFARLARPGLLLEALEAQSFGVPAALKDLILRTIGSGLVTNVLIGARSFATTPVKRDDFARSAESLETLVSSYTSLEENAGLKKDRRVQEELRAARVQLGSCLTHRLVAPIDGQLTASITRLDMPAEAAAPSTPEMADAEGYARLMRRCARMANAVGARDATDGRIKTACTKLESITGAVGGPGSDDRLYHALRLIEILAGPDEAERVLRGRSADLRPDRP